MNFSGNLTGLFSEVEVEKFSYKALQHTVISQYCCINDTKIKYDGDIVVNKQKIVAVVS